MLSSEYNILKQFATHIPASMWLKNVAGIYLMVNSTFCALVDKAESEVLGKKDYDLWDEADAAHYRRVDKSVMENRLPIVVLEHLPKNCHMADHLFETIKFPVFDAHHNVIAVGGISVDKTWEQHLNRVIHTSITNLEDMVSGPMEDA